MSSGFYLVKVGNDNRPAQQCDIDQMEQKLKKMVRNVEKKDDKWNVLVTHHAVDIQWVPCRESKEPTIFEVKPHKISRKQTTAHRQKLTNTPIFRDGMGGGVVVPSHGNVEVNPAKRQDVAEPKVNAVTHGNPNHPRPYHGDNPD